MPDPIPVVLLPANTNHPRTLPVDIRQAKANEWLRRGSFSPNTRKSYDRELRRFLRWTDLNWLELRPNHLALYKEYLVEEVGLGRASVNLAIAALRNFFGWLGAVYPALLPVNPMAGVKFEKLEMPPAQNLTTTEMSQVWAALNQLDETQLRDTVLVHLLWHGLRASEAVDLSLGVYSDRVLFIAKTKTHKPRMVPLRKVARGAISDYLEQRQQEGEVLTNASPMLLSYHPGHRGDRLTYYGVYQAIERLGELTGIEHLHPHRLRHTYATEILLQGLDPNHAMKLTGHGDARSFQRYTLAAEQQAAVNEFYRIYGEE